MTPPILIRRGGSWGTWHIVKPDTRLPICGQRSRLQTVYTASPELLAKPDLFRTHLCGTCDRLTGAQHTSPAASEVQP